MAELDIINARLGGYCLRLEKRRLVVWCRKRSSKSVLRTFSGNSYHERVESSAFFLNRRGEMWVDVKVAGFVGDGGGPWFSLSNHSW